MNWTLFLQKDIKNNTSTYQVWHKVILWQLEIIGDNGHFSFIYHEIYVIPTGKLVARKFMDAWTLYSPSTENICCSE